MELEESGATPFPESKSSWQGRSPKQVKANEDEAVLLSIVAVVFLVGWGFWEFGKWLVSLVVGM